MQVGNRLVSKAESPRGLRRAAKVGGHTGREAEAAIHVFRIAEPHCPTVEGGTTRRLVIPNVQSLELAEREECPNRR